MTEDMRRKDGFAIRRKVLGDAHVNHVEANKIDFEKPFQDLLVDAAWSQVWSRPQLTLRERSLITIALLAAAKHENELAMHIRATSNTGATPSDIQEVLLHVAIYAGIPTANDAMRIAKAELSKMGVNL